MDLQEIEQRVAAARAVLKTPLQGNLPRTKAGELPRWEAPAAAYYDGMLAFMHPPPGMTHEECRPRAPYEGDFVLPVGMAGEIELKNPAFAGMPCTVSAVCRGRSACNPARGLENLPTCTPSINGNEVFTGALFTDVFRGPLDESGSVTVPLRFEDAIGVLRGGGALWRTSGGNRAVRALERLHGTRVMAFDCYDLEVRLMVNGIGWSQQFAVCATAPFLPALAALRSDSVNLDISSSDMEFEDDLDATFVPRGGLPEHD